MKVAVFSTKPYERRFLDETNKKYGHELTYFQPRLTEETAPLAKGFSAVCIFVNDRVDDKTIKVLAENGVCLIALRCAGFNNVDIAAAESNNISVVRVPAYSPHAVAEHTIALLLAVNRKIYKSYARVREGNFELDGLLGFDLYGKTAGVIGTGKIGAEVSKILNGFGCSILAYDQYKNNELEKLGVKYTTLEELFGESDIISLHCPLTPETHHLIDQAAIEKMKTGVVILNTSRGALIDTKAVIKGLKLGKIGYLGLDVYEEEADLFFRDLSSKVIQDDIFARLLTFPNVVITGHQAFFTKNALEAIAETTLSNISEFEKSNSCRNKVPLEFVR